MEIAFEKSHTEYTEDELGNLRPEESTALRYAKFPGLEFEDRS